MIFSDSATLNKNTGRLFSSKLLDSVCVLHSLFIRPEKKSFIFYCIFRPIIFYLILFIQVSINVFNLFFLLFFFNFFSFIHFYLFIYLFFYLYIFCYFFLKIYFLFSFYSTFSLIFLFHICFHIFTLCLFICFSLSFFLLFFLFSSFSLFSFRPSTTLINSFFFISTRLIVFPFISSWYHKFNPLRIFHTSVSCQSFRVVWVTESPQVYWTLPNIQVEDKNSENCMVFTCLIISNSLSSFIKLLGIGMGAPITFGITVIFMFHRFLRCFSWIENSSQR